MERGEGREGGERERKKKERERQNRLVGYQDTKQNHTFSCDSN